MTVFWIAFFGTLGAIVWWLIRFFGKPLAKGPNTIDGTALWLARRRAAKAEQKRVRSQRRSWWARPNGTNQDGEIE